MNLLAQASPTATSWHQNCKDNENSEIVQAQKDTNTNVMTNETLDDTTKESTIAYLGETVFQSGIMVYPNNYKDG